jgi:hypothetical protein
MLPTCHHLYRLYHPTPSIYNHKPVSDQQRWIRRKFCSIRFSIAATFTTTTTSVGVYFAVYFAFANEGFVHQIIKSDRKNQKIPKMTEPDPSVGVEDYLSDHGEEPTIAAGGASTRSDNNDLGATASAMVRENDLLTAATANDLTTVVRLIHDGVYVNFVDLVHSLHS